MLRLKFTSGYLDMIEGIFLEIQRTLKKYDLQRMYGQFAQKIKYPVVNYFLVLPAWKDKTSMKQMACAPRCLLYLNTIIFREHFNQRHCLLKRKFYCHNHWVCLHLIVYFPCKLSEKFIMLL